MVFTGASKSVKVLEFGGFIFKAWKVFEKSPGPWKSLNFFWEVLESP